MCRFIYPIYSAIFHTDQITFRVNMKRGSWCKVADKFPALIKYNVIYWQFGEQEFNWCLFEEQFTMHEDCKLSGKVDEWMDVWMVGEWMDQWMDGWMDG